MNNSDSKKHPFNVGGLLLTKGPPKLKSLSGWKTTSNWHAAASVPVVPAQMVSFQSAAPVCSKVLEYDAGSANAFFPNLQGDAWALTGTKSNPAICALTISKLYPVTISLTLHCNCYSLPVGSSVGQLVVLVNKIPVGVLAVGSIWTDATVNIQATSLNPVISDTNLIEIVAEEGSYNIVSATIENSTVVTANYQWYSQFNGSLQPNASASFDQDLTVGLTNSSSQTKTFGTSLGISQSMGASVDAISATLSGSFSLSTQESSTVTISVNTQTQKSYQYAQTNPTGEAIAYAFWWLRLQYVLPNGASITIDAPPQATVLQTYYPPTESDALRNHLNSPSEAIEY
ncbi:hypothetical protein [Agaribacter flavus]|uniref:Uncharacterized protein n=1 Tax=Agaribacter flavus TaxID=1902781 RepID=A0ABV7FNH5_9ALTE